MPHTPLTKEEVAALLAPLDVRGGRVAVAVSGGADSMALAWCLACFIENAPCRFCSTNHPPLAGGSKYLRLKGENISGRGHHPEAQLFDPSPKNPPPAGSDFSTLPQGEGDENRLSDGRNAKHPLALIVDHRLRPESTEEAQEVAARLAAMGIASEILTWAHTEKPDSRIHVRARSARYRLLIEACKKLGIGTLFLAHHADDQAETVLMRLAKGSGVDGLSGIARQSERDGVRLLRPFLDVPKARLVATCEAAGIAFVRDPSNEKERYARGRLRRVMPLLQEEGLSAARLCDLAARAREAKEALDHYAVQFLQAHTRADDFGAIAVDLAPLAALPSAVAQRVIVYLLQAVSGGSDAGEDYPPQREALLDFVDWLFSGTEGQSARTLHGCLAWRKLEKNLVFFAREPGAISTKTPLAAGETVLWDGRWLLAAPKDMEGGLILAPLGFQTKQTLDALAPDLRKRCPWGRVRAGLPALWHGETLVAVPDFSKRNQMVVRATRKPFFWEKKDAKG